MDETTWDANTGQLVSVNYPRAVEINKRIEKAVNMNLTAQYASRSFQVIDSNRSSGAQDMLMFVYLFRSGLPRALNLDFHGLDLLSDLPL